MDVIYSNPSTRIGNLTEGNTYEVLTTEGDFYNLLNDRGLNRRYHTRLFTVVAPPEPAVPSVEERIRGIRIANVNNRCVLIFRNENNEECMVNSPLSSAGTSVSCGLAQLFNVNDLARGILSQTEEAEMASALFLKAIEDKLSRRDEGHYIISTNTDDRENSDINSNYRFIADCLEEIQVNSPDLVENENSGNQIAIWIVNRL